MIILIAGAAFYAYKKNIASPTITNSEEGKVLTIDPNATSTTIDGYTVERIEEIQVQAPDYKKPIPIGAAVSAEVRTAIEAQHADIRTKLDADNTDYSTWMRLAVLNKMAGNPQGAIDIWIFGTKIWPTDPVVYRNLGNMYYEQNKLSEGKKMYDKAIALAQASGDANLLAQLEAEKASR
jgi:tetratricopeptide (TPR) repeat protein